MNQSAHAREMDSFGDIDGGNQIHLKASVDVVDIRFAHRCRKVNHAIGTDLLKSVDKHRHIADIAANHRQVRAGHMPDVVRSRRQRRRT